MEAEVSMLSCRNSFDICWYTAMYKVLTVGQVFFHIHKIQCGAVIKRSIFCQIFTNDTHSSPVRDPASDWYSASVPLVIYVISYNIGPPYNDTRLYCCLLFHPPPQSKCFGNSFYLHVWILALMFEWTVQEFRNILKFIGSFNSDEI